MIHKYPDNIDRITPTLLLIVVLLLGIIIGMNFSREQKFTLELKTSPKTIVP